MIVTYSMACTEVLSILNYYLSKNELNKIPEEIMEFLNNNKDKNYKYEIDKNLPLEKQNISVMANSIIITLYRDYFANKQQNKSLKEILKINDERNKRISYKNENIHFNFKDNIGNKNNKAIDTALVEVRKEKWYNKFLKIIKKFLKI